MGKILRTEIKRSLTGLGFLLSVISGIIFVLYRNYGIYSQDRKFEDMGYYLSFSKLTFYDRCMLGYLDGTVLYIFYVLGIIVALPFGISYYRDRKKGVIKNICVRTEKKYYLLSKYIAVFLSGGIVAAMSLIADLLIVRLYNPIDFLRINGRVLSCITEWNVFIIDHLYVSAAIFIFLWFLYGGALATTSLLAATFSDNFFTIQLTPFFVMMVFFYLPSFIGGNSQRYFPFAFLTLFGDSNPFIAIGFSSIIIIVTFSIFMGINVRKDIL